MIDIQRIASHQLSFFNERPDGIEIDTIVIHSMHNPEVSDPYSVEACVELLGRCQVSAHYLISRNGEIFSLVPDKKRAWHAGKSVMRNEKGQVREDVNDFSIGVELIGTDLTPFTEAQYKSLNQLTLSLSRNHKISYIVGHSHIAPGRKTDPGVAFDWLRYENELPRNLFSFPYKGAV